MAKNPSIHITLDSLRKVLSTVGIAPEKALIIMQEAHKYRITDRYKIEGNADTRRKAERMVNASSVDAKYFGALLAQERISASHRGVKPIREGSADYIMLKEIAELVNDFVKYHEITNLEVGARYYIRTGLKMMGKRYSLNRFKYYNNKITERYEADYAISTDDDKEGTEAFLTHYNLILQKYAGIEDEEISKDVEKYVCMLYGRLEAEEADAYYDDWITAQFEGLAFLNAVPNPAQLFGENALNRYKTYVRDMNIKKKRVVNKSYNADKKLTKYKEKRAE